MLWLWVKLYMSRSNLRNILNCLQYFLALRSLSNSTGGLFFCQIYAQQTALPAQQPVPQSQFTTGTPFPQRPSYVQPSTLPHPPPYQPLYVTPNQPVNRPAYSQVSYQPTPYQQGTFQQGTFQQGIFQQGSFQPMYNGGRFSPQARPAPYQPVQGYQPSPQSIQSYQTPPHPIYYQQGQPIYYQNGYQSSYQGQRFVSI